MMEQWDDGKRKIRCRWVPKPDGNISRVGGICIKDKKICLVRSKKGKRWVIPGGKPEPGETYEQTLRREIDEEASLEISDPLLLGATENFVTGNPKKNEGDHFFQLYYIAKITKIKEQSPDPDGEILRERRFIDPEEFTDYIKWGSIAEKIKEGICQSSLASQEDNRL